MQVGAPVVCGFVFQPGMTRATVDADLEAQTCPIVQVERADTPAESVRRFFRLWDTHAFTLGAAMVMRGVDLALPGPGGKKVYGCCSNRIS